MNTPEEPQPPFEFQRPFQEVPYDQLPPYMQKAFDAALGALENNLPPGGVHAFTFTDSAGFNGTNADHTIQSKPQPQYWARWEYSDEEWKLFDKLDWGRARNKLLITAAISTLVCLSFNILISIGFLSAPLPPGIAPDFSILAILIPVGFLLPTFLITFAFAGRQFQEARKRHKGRKTGPKRVTIGTPSYLNDQGLWEAGSFVPLQETFLKLSSVKMTEHPPLLHLRRKHLELRQSSWHDTVRVLVPYGHEAEAAHLVERFSAETIASQKKDYTPAEPG